MNIVIVNKGLPIPAVHYGGTERVIWGLGYELTKMGHDVTFITPPGSKCDFARVIPLDENKSINELIPAETDIVHFNSFLDESCNFPFVFTLHGNNPEEHEINPYTIYISKNQAERNGGKTFVYNGLLWEDYPEVSLTKERKYLHFLGKARWKVKNFAGACEIALKANEKLLVMGGKRFEWYNFKNKPFYTLNPKIKYLNFVDNSKKISIIEESKGLVFPVKWHEPFGLAIIESMYAGAPVFGTEMGSLPELVKSEVGFLSDDYDKIADVIKNSSFSAKVCHEYAVENFSARIMAENYLKQYEKVLNGEKLN